MFPKRQKFEYDSKDLMIAKLQKQLEIANQFNYYEPEENYDDDEVDDYEDEDSYYEDVPSQHEECDYQENYQSEEQTSGEGTSAQEQPQTKTDDTDTNKPKEVSLDAEILDKVGKNPHTQKAQKLTMLDALADIFIYFKNNGITDEERRALLSKYEIPPAFSPPDLTAGIELNTAQKYLNKERHRFKVQEDLCAALTINVSLLSILNDQKENNKRTEKDKNEEKAEENVEQTDDKKKDDSLFKGFKGYLTESSTLIANAIFQETQSRKAFMAPAFKYPLQGIVKKCQTDSRLFGNQFMEKADEQFKLSKYMNTSSKPKPKVQNNFLFRPFGPRGPPPPQTMFQTNQQMPLQYTFAPGLPRQRLPFRGRGGQAFRGGPFQTPKQRPRQKQQLMQKQ